MLKIPKEVIITEELPNVGFITFTLDLENRPLNLYMYSKLKKAGLIKEDKCSLQS